MTVADTGADRLQPYEAREAAFLGVRDIAAFRLKVYTLIAKRRDIAQPLIEAALKKAESVLSGDYRRPGGLEPHGIGFVVIHGGQDANWILIDWWVDGAILTQRLYRSELDLPTAFIDLTHRGLVHCVWEGEIVDFERRAFIETMMTARPNPTAYLVRTCAGEI